MEEEYYFEESNPKKIKIIIIAIIVVLIIISLIGFFMKKKYTFNIKREVSYEVGETIIKDLNKYVTSKIIDEEDYKISFNNVPMDNDILNKVGEYTYTVKYKNLSKKGTIKVVDKVAPKVEVIDLYISKGSTYSEDDFILSCEDYSKPCLVSYAKEEYGQYKEDGEYTIKLVIKDQENNEITKEAKLIIGDIDNSKIRNDLEIDHIDPEFSDYDNSMTIRYDKAVDSSELDSNSEFEKLLELIGSDLHSYISEDFNNNLIEETDIIKIYNKYNFIIGFSIRIKLDNGLVFYLTDKNYQEN